MPNFCYKSHFGGVKWVGLWHFDFQNKITTLVGGVRGACYFPSQFCVIVVYQFQFDGAFRHLQNVKTILFLVEPELGGPEASDMTIALPPF